MMVCLVITCRHTFTSMLTQKYEEKPTKTVKTKDKNEEKRRNINNNNNNKWT